MVLPWAPTLQGPESCCVHRTSKRSCRWMSRDTRVWCSNLPNQRRNDRWADSLAAFSAGQHPKSRPRWPLTTMIPSPQTPRPVYSFGSRKHEGFTEKQHELGLPYIYSSAHPQTLASLRPSSLSLPQYFGWKYSGGVMW